MHDFGISLDEIQPFAAGAESGANYTVVRRAAPAHQDTKKPYARLSKWPRSTVRAG